MTPESRAWSRARPEGPARGQATRLGVRDSYGAFNRDALISHAVLTDLASSRSICSSRGRVSRYGMLSFWHISMQDPLLGTRVLEIVLHLVENLGISCGHKRALHRPFVLSAMSHRLSLSDTDTLTPVPCPLLVVTISSTAAVGMKTKH